MSRRLRLAVVAWVAFLGLALFVLDVVLSGFVTALETSPRANRPAYSVQESRSRGAFIETVTVEPATFEWGGQRVTFREAWLERQTELVSVSVYFPFGVERRNYRTVSGYNLCVTLAEGWDAFGGINGGFLVAEGNGSSFGKHGTAVICEQFDSLSDCPHRVLVTDNWKMTGSRPLEIRRPGR